MIEGKWVSRASTKPLTRRDPLVASFYTKLNYEKPSAYFEATTGAYDRC